MRNAHFWPVWQLDCPIIRHVLILALDTSSPAGSLAVLRDDTIIATAPAWSGELYSSRMFRQLELLLHEHDLRLDAIEVFAVVVGPGSFTGLRVGLAAVKGWAEVYRKPIAAVSALEAVAAQSSLDVPALVPVLDARRAQIYFGIYERALSSNGRDLELAGQECVATPEEFFGALDSRYAASELAIVTPVPELLASAMSRYETTRSTSGHFRVEQASPVLAPHVARIGHGRALEGKLVDSLALDANYVRRSDAELHWKAPAGS